MSTTSRVQLALSVSDLEASIAFYSMMFGVEPHKLRPGYANFEVADPPLKLVLIEVPAAERGTGPQGALNHLGVEVPTTDQVVAELARIEGAGLTVNREDDTVCCYARQDKGWIHDPAGTPWEYYTITDDDPAGLLPMVDAMPEPGACCADTPVETSVITLDSPSRA